MSNGLLIILVAVISLPPQGSEDPAKRTETICGPRCIEWLLNYYRRPDEDLLDLVRDVQGAPHRDATFADLERALRKRGINCKLVRLRTYSLLVWGEPAIVHLNGKHFAIAECPNSTNARVWLGVPGTCELDPLDLRAQMSSTVLLTSATPVAEQVDYSSAALQWMIVSLCIVSGGAAVGVLHRRRRSKRTVLRKATRRMFR